MSRPSQQKALDQHAVLARTQGLCEDVSKLLSRLHKRGGIHATGDTITELACAWRSRGAAEAGGVRLRA